MKTLSPRKLTGKSSYVLDITDRETGKRTARGLGTDDEQTAHAISHDYCRLLERADLLTDPLHHIHDLMAFKVKAVELALGSDHPAVAKLRDMSDTRIGLTSEDMNEIAVRVYKDNLEIAKKTETDENAAAVTAALAAGDTRDPNRKVMLPVAQVHTILERFMPVKMRALTEQNAALRIENATLKSRWEDAQRIIDSLRKQTNTHVTVTVAEAFKAYVASDRFSRKALQTRNEMESTFKLLLASLPNSDLFKLADLRHTHIQEWLDKARKDDGQPYSTRSIQKMRAYVSSIVNSLNRTYDLGANPMDKLEPAVTPKRDRNTIEAIHSAKDLKSMLDTLGEQSDYWQAFVATAMLAGPRYTELVHLHIDDVDLDQNDINVRGMRDESGNLLQGTKTGKRRRTPIEQTVLRGILESHVERRRAEQKKKSGTEAEKSVWLFPSIVLPNPYTVREKSLPGTWSSNKVCMDAYDKIVDAITAKSGDRYYWKFGPQQWRHSACTAMGNSGVDAENGSQWVGNSPQVWRDHYKAPSSNATRWPFKY